MISPKALSTNRAAGSGLWTTACQTPTLQAVYGHIILKAEYTDCGADLLLLRHPGKFLRLMKVAFLISDTPSTGFGFEEHPMNDQWWWWLQFLMWQTPAGQSMLLALHGHSTWQGIPDPLC